MHQRYLCLYYSGWLLFLRYIFSIECSFKKSMQDTIKSFTFNCTEFTLFTKFTKKKLWLAQPFAEWCSQSHAPFVSFWAAAHLMVLARVRQAIKCFFKPFIWFSIVFLQQIRFLSRFYMQIILSSVFRFSTEDFPFSLFSRIFHFCIFAFFKCSSWHDCILTEAFCFAHRISHPVPPYRPPTPRPDVAKILQICCCWLLTTHSPSRSIAEVRR